MNFFLRMIDLACRIIDVAVLLVEYRAEHRPPAQPDWGPYCYQIPDPKVWLALRRLSDTNPVVVMWEYPPNAVAFGDDARILSAGMNIPLIQAKDAVYVAFPLDWARENQQTVMKRCDCILVITSP